MQAASRHQHTNNELLSGRTERYNHDLDTEDTEDDGEDILFHSFSSCSPRYSKVYSKIEELHQDVSSSGSVMSQVMCQSLKKKKKRRRRKKTFKRKKNKTAKQNKH